MNDKIFITMPAYNEESTIKQVIDDIKKSMVNYNHQIQVVDDGSTDKTAEIAKQEGAVVISHPKKYGLAETFKTEMKECLKENVSIIVHIDADGQYLPSEIPLLVKTFIKEKADLVLGSRFLGTIEKMPLIKRLGNKAFSKVISHITKFKISDGQTGFRCFNRKVAEMELISDFTYTQEQLIRAIKSKLKVVEVPVTFLKRDGPSRLLKNPFEYAIKAWVNILRVYRDYEPLKFFTLVGLMPLLFGSLLGVYILIRISIGIGSGGVPRIILSGLLIITGLQIILLGFLADKKNNEG